MQNFLKIKNLKKILNTRTGLFVCLILFSLSAEASSVAQYPWAKTLKSIMDSLDGPVAYAAAGIAIVVSGLVMAFSDLAGGAKKFVQAAVGISIAFGAVTLLSTFFNFSSAVV